MVESFGNINKIIKYAKNSNTKPLAAIGPLLNSSNLDNRPEAEEPIISPWEKNKYKLITVLDSIRKGVLLCNFEKNMS